MRWGFRPEGSRGKRKEKLTDQQTLKPEQSVSVCRRHRIKVISQAPCPLQLFLRWV